MKQLTNKTIFFGASSYVLPLIDFLNNTYDLQLIITTESNPTDAVPHFCQQRNIPYLCITKLDEETLEKIKQIHAPFAVLADFRLIIKQHVIDLFPKGIINIHPSLLPKYRGPTPATTALLNGKIQTGVSLMLLDKDMDHGPLLAQDTEDTLPHDTSVTLYTRLFAKGAKLLEKILPEYLNGKLSPYEQEHSKATYTEFLTRESGFVAKETLEQMDKEKRNNMIRAYFPWPGVWTKLNLNGNERIVKLLPSVIPSDKACPELVEWVEGSQPKVNILLQVEGKKAMSPKDFLNGYPQTKGFLEKLGYI